MEHESAQQCHAGPSPRMQVDDVFRVNIDERLAVPLDDSHERPINRPGRGVGGDGNADGELIQDVVTIDDRASTKQNAVPGPSRQSKGIGRLTSDDGARLEHGRRIPVTHVRVSLSKISF
jgi:hypothetical protein